MYSITRTIPLAHGVDRARFESEIVPAGQPVVLKGLVNDWPAVMAGRGSPGAAAAYFKGLDQGRTTHVSLLPPEHKGHYFYAPDMQGFNFKVDKATPGQVMDWLLQNGANEQAPTAYVQSLMLAEHMPGFDAVNPMPLLRQHTGSRLWIGNRVRTQTHFDPSYNIACVVAGRRRFTLFPPEQIVNLYPSAFDASPGGVPVSMASLENPDFDAYPRLAQALETAQSADLEPGDAIYVPYAWWHHVQSLEGFNLLVNYWWNGLGDVPPPNASLFLALMTVRDLPPEAKAVWKRIFDLYVFGEETSAMSAHLPPDGRGAFGPPTAAVVGRIRAYVKQILGL